MWLLITTLAVADPAPPEVRYRRNADVALYGGLAAAIVPPVATGVAIALRAEQIGGPPNLFEVCRNGPIEGLVCAVFFPVMLVIQAVMYEMWLIDVVVGAAVYTAPLYPVLPFLLSHTSMRARRALLDVGGANVPGGWGIVGYSAFGVHLAAMTVGAVGLALEDDESELIPVAGAVAVGGWAISVTAGLVQWTIDSRVAREIGVADATRRGRFEVPMMAISGRF